MHRLLERQMKRWLRGDGTSSPDEYRVFLEAVDQAYRAFDEDRSMLERSLELSSQELLAANSELVARNEALARHQQYLHRLALIDEPDLDAALAEIVRVGADALEVRRVGVWLYNGDRTAIRCRHLHDDRPESKMVCELLRAADHPIYFEAITTARTVAAHDVTRDRRAAELGSYLERWGITSMLDVPIWVQGRVAGVVCFEHVGPPRTWTPEEERFAASVADFVALAMTASEGQQMEAQLRQSQKMEAIGVLAGGVAHEYNNLLTAVLGHAEILKRNLPDGPERADADQIHAAARRAADLTRHLLAFSRKQIVVARVFDVNELISGITPVLRQVIGEDVDLVSRLSPAPALIEADQGQIQQALMNLVVNAREAMPTGGKVTIQTSHVAGDRVMIRVTDTGRGIAPEIVPRVFEPFFSTKPRGQGSGLGLSTTYGIVSQAGGEIGVDCEPGSGAEFWMRFPAARVAKSVEVTTENPATEDRSEQVVLLVEDEALVSRLVHRVLTGSGLRVIQAASGEEALQKADGAGRIDLLLTDVVMPRMNGRQLADLLGRVRPGLKVLFMSGYTGGELMSRDVLAPGNAFLAKPFMPDDLLGKVREILGTGSAQSAAVSRTPHT